MLLCGSGMLGTDAGGSQPRAKDFKKQPRGELRKEGGGEGGGAGEIPAATRSQALKRMVRN